MSRLSEGAAESWERKPMPAEQLMQLCRRIDDTMRLRAQEDLRTSVLYRHAWGLLDEPTRRRAEAVLEHYSPADDHQAFTYADRRVLTETDALRSATPELFATAHAAMLCQPGSRSTPLHRDAAQYMAAYYTDGPMRMLASVARQTYADYQQAMVNALAAAGVRKPASRSDSLSVRANLRSVTQRTSVENTSRQGNGISGPAAR